MYDQSSICAADRTSKDQCLLDYTNVKNPTGFEGVNCRQGNLPSYYVEVQSVNDAVKAFEYAEKSGTTLTIKNSGHSFLEDSTGKGSLVLWTQNLKSLKYDGHFVPLGCSLRETFRVITTGAGVNCGEAYEYANKVGATILCGNSPTVGISRGWVQNGGHSILSNAFGLGADRVVQYTVVTPDGEIRIANKCQNSDLFWALTGGGGGTFGVVIDSTHLVESAVPIGTASIGFPSKDKDDVYDFTELLFDTALDLAEDGWGGHIYGNSIIYVTPTLTTEESIRKSMARIIAFAEGHGGTANITIATSWYDFYSKEILGAVFKVGDLSILNTRLIPTKVHVDPTLRANFKVYLRDFVDNVAMPYVPVDTPYLYKTKPNATSAHPAWYSSLWSWGYHENWSWNSTYAERVETVKRMQKRTADMEAVSPGGGAYKNEANPFTPNWQETYFGTHYDALLSIKNKYDPLRLLRCWRCVGWTEEDAEKSCYRDFGNVRS
jgi:FAD/FMN-containing dehydrogenase